VLVRVPVRGGVLDGLFDLRPGLFLVPLQLQGPQHLTCPAALHTDALLAQIGYQAVQRPRRERQTQLGRPR